jgi:hypothetical protein
MSCLGSGPSSIATHNDPHLYDGSNPNYKRGKKTSSRTRMKPLSHISLVRTSLQYVEDIYHPGAFKLNELIHNSTELDSDVAPHIATYNKTHGSLMISCSITADLKDQPRLQPQPRGAVLVPLCILKLNSYNHSFWAKKYISCFKSQFDYRAMLSDPCIAHYIYRKYGQSGLDKVAKSWVQTVSAWTNPPDVRPHFSESNYSKLTLNRTLTLVAKRMCAEENSLPRSHLLYPSPDFSKRSRVVRRLLVNLPKQAEEFNLLELMGVKGYLEGLGTTFKTGVSDFFNKEISLVLEQVAAATQALEACHSVVGITATAARAVAFLRHALNTGKNLYYYHFAMHATTAVLAIVKRIILWTYPLWAEAFNDPKEAESLSADMPPAAERTQEGFFDSESGFFSNIASSFEGFSKSFSSIRIISVFHRAVLDASSIGEAIVDCLRYFFEWLTFFFTGQESAYVVVSRRLSAFLDGVQSLQLCTEEDYAWAYEVSYYQKISVPLMQNCMKVPNFIASRRESLTNAVKFLAEKSITATAILKKKLSSVPPVAISMSGTDPGTGKSVLMKHLLRVSLDTIESKTLSDDEFMSRVWNYHKDGRFDDGLIGNETAVYFDDLFRDIEPGSEANKADFSTAHEIGSGMPYNGTSPHLSSKGNLTVSFVAAGFCTNVPHTAIRERCGASEDTLARRFPIRVKVVVKDRVKLKELTTLTGEAYLKLQKEIVTYELLDANYATLNILSKNDLIELVRAHSLQYLLRIIESKSDESPRTPDDAFVTRMAEVDKLFYPLFSADMEGSLEEPRRILGLCPIFSTDEALIADILSPIKHAVRSVTAKVEIVKSAYKKLSIKIRSLYSRTNPSEFDYKHEVEMVPAEEFGSCRWIASSGSIEWPDSESTLDLRGLEPSVLSEEQHISLHTSAGLGDYEQTYDKKGSLLSKANIDFSKYSIILCDTVSFPEEYFSLRPCSDVCLSVEQKSPALSVPRMYSTWADSEMRLRLQGCSIYYSPEDAIRGEASSTVLAKFEEGSGQSQPAKPDQPQVRVPVEEEVYIEPHQIFEHFSGPEGIVKFLVEGVIITSLVTLARVGVSWLLMPKSSFSQESPSRQKKKDPKNLQPAGNASWKPQEGSDTANPHEKRQVVLVSKKLPVYAYVMCSTVIAMTYHDYRALIDTKVTLLYNAQITFVLGQMKAVRSSNEFGDQDLMLVHVPNLVARDFSSRLPSANHWKAGFTTGILLKTADRPPIYCTNIKTRTDEVTILGSVSRTYRGTADYRQGSGISKGGDCGRVLVSSCVNCEGEALGLHIGGMQGDGSICRFVRDDIKKGLEKLRELLLSSGIPAIDEQGLSSRISAFMNEGGNNEESPLPGPFIALGDVRQSFRPQQFKTTKLRKSNLSLGPTLTGPPVLSSFDGSHLDYVKDKWAEVREYNLDPPSMEAVTRMRLNYIPPASPHMPEVLSNEQVIVGVEDTCFVGMELSTSSGFIFETLKRLRHSLKKGKREFISVSDTKEVWVDPILTEDVLALENLALAGKPVPGVYQASEKDERLLNEDLDKGKVRLIMVGGLSYLVLFRKYFGSFCEAVTRSHSYAEFSATVGISPARTQEFEHLYHSLRDFAESIMEIDVSGWDKAFPLSLFRGFILLANLWYAKYYSFSAMNNRTRTCVACGMVYGIVVVLGKVLIMALGVFSGGPATTVVNCVGHEIGAYCVLYDHCMEHSLSIPISEFPNIFRPKVFGDDGIYACRLPSFTQIEFAKGFKKRFGMKATPAGDKHSAFEAFREIDTTSFLKRSFVKVDGEVRGCLHKSVIHEMCRWYRTSASPFVSVAVYQNVDAALRESFLWGRAYFEENLALFNAAMAEKGWDLSTLTYDYLLLQFHGEGVGPPIY